MTFREGLVSARGHIVFVLGLVAAFSLVIALERWDVEAGIRERALAGLPDAAVVQPSSDIPTAPGPRPLTADERRWAEVAWRYFEQNTRPETGLADSVAGFPATTMWDTGSYLLGTIAAERLGLLPRDAFDRRLAAALASLARLPLFDGALPNKSYDTRTLAMTDYNGNPTGRGIGWSAIDIGRVLIPLGIVAWGYPEHAAAAEAVLARWRLDRVVEGGLLHGMTVGGDGVVATHQEGRIGYEEYAALAYALVGHDTFDALQVSDFLEWVDVEGVQVPADRRDPATLGAHTYVLSEPYALRLLEFDPGATSRELAFRVYRAQERRYERERVLTAVTEDHLDRPPHFVYNTVYANGKAWNTITDAGADASEFRTLSSKAALSWAALYDTPYTRRLAEAAAKLHDPQRGWYAGSYEKDGSVNTALTANTNGIILEGLHYRRFGPMLRPSGAKGEERAATSASEAR